MDRPPGIRARISLCRTQRFV